MHMRKPVGKVAHFKRGDTVRIVCSLPAGQTLARISVWSALKDEQLSPHVPVSLTEFLVDGRPTMVKPLAFRLDRDIKRVTHETSFIAEDDMAVCLMQDVDRANDPVAKGKVKHDGKVAQGFRRFGRNTIRFLGRCATYPFRAHA